MVYCQSAKPCHLLLLGSSFQLLIPLRLQEEMQKLGGRVSAMPELLPDDQDIKDFSKVVEGGALRSRGILKVMGTV